MTELRKLADAGVGFDRALWKELAQLGWVGLVLPEAHGGAGLGWLHLEIVIEEMGRRLVPGPFLGSLLAGVAIAEGGSAAQRERLLPAIASGDSVATIALCEAGGVFEASGVTATAEPANGGFVLRGQKTHVLCGADANLVVAPFREPSGEIALFAVELPATGVSIEAEVGIDPTRPTARIAFDGVRVPAAARLDGDAAAAWHAMLVRGFAALAAEQVGGAESVLLETRDYAIARKQFDRQIGFFQAVKYPIVDMMCGIELSRSLAVGAAAALDATSPRRGDAGAHGEGADQRRLLQRRAQGRAAPRRLRLHLGLRRALLLPPRDVESRDARRRHPPPPLARGAPLRGLSDAHPDSPFTAIRHAVLAKNLW